MYGINKAIKSTVNRKSEIPGQAKHPKKESIVSTENATVTIR